MKWIDTLEARFGRFAIPGLLHAVAIVNVLVFIGYKLYPPFFAMLDLYPNRVMDGELWRLVTYIFIPSICSMLPTPDWFNAAMFVMFLFWMGKGLDAAWGPFRTNLFYLLGMIGTTIAAFFFGAHFSNVILNTSVLFAFARFYPDEFILFYVLPVKVKWAAWASFAWLVYKLVPLGPSFQMAVVAALINYLIFFGPEIVHDARHRRDVTTRRRRFERDLQAGSGESLHRCAVCNKTEVTDPDLDFRVAKDGNEYCTEHLPRVNAQA
jgi:hypothetical protein